METEVYILSGFLGSGKTTLLKRLLENERSLGRKTAVIMNELGSISIDSNIVKEDVTLKELLGGCICCSMQDSLEMQLQSLLIQNQPEAIYIETTGAAYPFEVLDAVLSPQIADKLQVKGIITTVDGLRWLNRKTLNPELQKLIIEQVRFADFVIINKIDELTEDEQCNVTIDIQSVNKTAPCLLTNYSKVSIAKLRSLSKTMSWQSEQNQNLINKKINLSAFVYSFKNSVSQLEFEDFIRTLPDTIYRVKGYVKFGQSDYPFMFQFSYGMPLYMKEFMDFPLNLVFIGEKMNWGNVAQQLSALEQSC